MEVLILDIIEIKEKLKKYNQEHLSNCYEKLAETEKEYLLSQIEKIDFDQINDLIEKTKKKIEFGDCKIDPIDYVEKAKNQLKYKRKHWNNINELIICSNIIEISIQSKNYFNKFNNLKKVNSNSSYITNYN